jgi:methionine aminotransferase
MTFSSKLPDIGTTIFTVMSQMANECGAINLSQGFPDFEPPVELLDMCTKYLKSGFNQYPPMMGVPYLREQIVAKISNLYGVTLNPDTEITVTSGATESLFVAIQTVVKNGDEVIVFDPAYDSYEPAVTLAGGKTIHIPMSAPDFQLDFEHLKDALSSKTRLIIVNSPHNPCGSVFQPSDLEELAALTRDLDLYFLSDEVYEHMIYDGGSHHSLLAHAELKEKTFVVSSFGKTYHATGWKIAYCAAPAELTAEFRKIHQFVTFTTHTPSQWALAEYMEHYPEHYLQLPAFYQDKRDLFIASMKGSGFEMKPSAGTYFQLADYSNLADMGDRVFSEFLTREVGVAAIPISVFYQNPPNDRIVRFCFAKSDSTIIEATEKLSNLQPVKPS